MGYNRKTVESPVNGREIGRGTVVALVTSGSTSPLPQDPVGVVEHLVGDRAAQVIFPTDSRSRALSLNDPVASASYRAKRRVNFARLSGRRGQYMSECRVVECALDMLVPVGEVKRIPSCKYGRWAPASPRKHRVRANEIGHEIRALQGALDLAKRHGSHGHEPEIERRLVILDRKLERLPEGPRRKHR